MTAQLKEMILKVKQEVETNKVANDVFHMFALRQRARKTITMRSLLLRMRSEGFEYTPEQYAQVLKFLASMGIGKLDQDYKGSVRGLKDISVTLQSLGKAAFENASPSQLRIRHRYKALPIAPPLAYPKVASMAPKRPAIESVPAPKPSSTSKPLEITLSTSQGPIKVIAPQGCDTATVMRIIEAVQQSRKAGAA